MVYVAPVVSFRAGSEIFLNIIIVNLTDWRTRRNIHVAN